jgi:glyoxylase-like metal-dependent hydrolase (beta-lactamase superfamily II)
MFQTKVITIPVLGKYSVSAYLLLGRQPIVVDAGTPGSAQLIYDQIASHGVNPQDIRLIVVIHGHVDHFGSAAELSRLTGAPIAGHIADFSIYRAGGASAPVPDRHK